MRRHRKRPGSRRRDVQSRAEVGFTLWEPLLLDQRAERNTEKRLGMPCAPTAATTSAASGASGASGAASVVVH